MSDLVRFNRVPWEINGYGSTLNLGFQKFSVWLLGKQKYNLAEKQEEGELGVKQLIPSATYVFL